MKKYRLKQWYPDTPSYMMEGFIVDYYDEEEKAIYTYPDGMRLGFKLPSHHLECRNFWELVEEEKPLFVTEDGVGIFEGDEYIAIGINYDFSKVDMVAHDQAYSGDVIRFKYESNADEYILWNKPLLSLNEIDDRIEMYAHEFEELIKLAKEKD